jgi:two-component sensor histidine kinase
MATAGTSAGAAVASVSSQANRITRLLGDLRKLADLEPQEIETAQVDLPSLLHEVEEAIGAIPSASERVIRVNVPRAPWPLPLIEGDRDLLFIALQNLIANAVKFSAPGDTVEVRASEDGSWLLLEVADTGAGIPEDEIGEVWHELARGRAARSLPGTGIGLALVRVVVIRHGGQVAIRSRDGQGTVVSIRLPVPSRAGTAPVSQTRDSAAIPAAWRLSSFELTATRLTERHPLNIHRLMAMAVRICASGLSVTACTAGITSARPAMSEDLFDTTGHRLRLRAATDCEASSLPATIGRQGQAVDAPGLALADLVVDGFSPLAVIWHQIWLARPVQEPATDPPGRGRSIHRRVGGRFRRAGPGDAVGFPRLGAPASRALLLLAHRIDCPNETPEARGYDRKPIDSATRLTLCN